MNFTEFYCDPVNGDNRNGGDGSSLVTSTNGNWDGSTVFTAAGGTPFSGVTAGQFASVYLDGASSPTGYIARVVSVNGGGASVTLDGTAIAGSAPTSGATGRTIKIGGVWLGPNGASAFPFSLTTHQALKNTNGDVPRFNMRSNGTFTISATITANPFPMVLQGYTATAGDGGRATISGGSSGTSFNLLNFGGTVRDIIFSGNGSTGSTAGVAAGGSNKPIYFGCVFTGMVGSGVSINGALAVECEAYGNNTSNTAGFGGFTVGPGGRCVRCYSHANTGSNSHGFVDTSTVGDAFVDCVADSNGGNGFIVTGSQSGPLSLLNCDSYNNTGDGFHLSYSSSGNLYLENCNACKNGGYGANISAGGQVPTGLMLNCGFGSGSDANALGQFPANIGGMVASGTISYTSPTNPWNAPATGDFSITAAAAKNTGRGTFTQTGSGKTGTIGYPDVGAAQANATAPTPLSTPTLAIADNAATPTGGTATIAGSSAGSTNTVSYQVINNSNGWTPNVWTSVGSRTGNGTIAISLPTGIYWFRCVSTLNGQVTVSNLVAIALTDGLAAVHERCLLAIEAGLQTLIAAGKIPGITLASNLYDQIELNLQGMDLPGIGVCTNLPGQTSQETQEGGPNERDDIGYPCQVVLLDRAGGNYIKNRPGYLKARQTIFRYFRGQALSGVIEVYTTKVETGPILKIEQGSYQVIGSVLTIRPVSREARGS